MLVYWYTALWVKYLLISVTGARVFLGKAYFIREGTKSIAAVSRLSFPSKRKVPTILSTEPPWKQNKINNKKNLQSDFTIFLKNLHLHFKSHFCIFISMFLLAFKAETETNTAQDWHLLEWEKTRLHIFFLKYFFQISYFRKSCWQADGRRDARLFWIF